MTRALICGFDYRLGRVVQKPRRQWREEMRAAVDAGGQRRIIVGDTLIFERVPVDLGAPFGVRPTLVLTQEVHGNV